MQPVAVVGFGALGTVYKARRFSIDATNTILSYATTDYTTSNTTSSSITDPSPSSQGTLQPGGPSPSSSTTPTPFPPLESGTLSPSRVSSSPSNQPSSSSSQPSPTSSSHHPYEWVAVKEVIFEESKDELDDVLKEAGLTYSLRNHPFIVGFRGSFVHSGISSKIWASRGVTEALVLEAMNSLYEPIQQQQQPSSSTTISTTEGGKGTLKPGQDHHHVPPTTSKDATNTTNAVATTPRDGMVAKTIRFSSYPAVCIVQQLIVGVSLTQVMLARIEKGKMNATASPTGSRKPSSHADPHQNTTTSPPSPQQDHRLSPKEVAVVARSVLHALLYLHSSARITHRDVKCSNILLDGGNGGRVVLCDFGASGAVDTPMSKRFTVIGTPGWIAPEVMSNTISSVGSGHGLLSDIWSFGILLLQLALLRPASNTNDSIFANAVKHFSSVPCTPQPSSTTSSQHRTWGSGGGLDDDDGGITFGGGGGGARRDHHGSPSSQPPVNRSTFNLPEGERLLTPLFQDFIACCLRREPSNRWGAAMLMEHPFLLGELGDGHAALAPEIFESVTQGILNETITLCPDFGPNAPPPQALQSDRPHTSSSRRSNERRQFSFEGLSKFGTVFSDGKRKADVTSAVGSPTSNANSHLPGDAQSPSLSSGGNGNGAMPSWVHPSITKASSRAVLEGILVPAARASPLIAEKIVRNYEPVWAVHVADPRLAGRSRTQQHGVAGEPVKEEAPISSSIPTTPVVLEAQELLSTYTTSDSQPPSTSSINNTTSAQADLSEMLRRFQQNPVHTEKARKLMARQVELLTKLEGRLPGFSEELMRRFMGNLAGELGGGGGSAVVSTEEEKEARRTKALAQMKARSQLFRKLQEDPLASSGQARARAACNSTNLSSTSPNPTEALLAKISVPHWSTGTLYCREREVVAAVQSVTIGDSRTPTGAPPPEAPKGAFYFTPPRMPGVASSEMRPGAVDATSYLYNSMMEEYASSM